MIYSCNENDSCYNPLLFRNQNWSRGESPEPLTPLVPQEPFFYITKNIRLVPPFSEKDVDRYFAHFERVATTLKLPKEVLPLMLQYVFTGEVSVSVGVISTATITGGYSMSDCTSFTVNQNL